MRVAMGLSLSLSLWDWLQAVSAMSLRWSSYVVCTHSSQRLASTAWSTIHTSQTTSIAGIRSSTAAAAAHGRPSRQNDVVKRCCRRAVLFLSLIVSPMCSDFDGFCRKSARGVSPDYGADGRGGRTVPKIDCWIAARRWTSNCNQMHAYTCPVVIFVPWCMAPR